MRRIYISLIALITVLLAVLCFASCEAPEIKENITINGGVVYDKTYTSGYEYTYNQPIVYEDGSLEYVPQQRWVNPEWRVYVKQTIDGEEYTRSYEVTEQEYENIYIGDYYPPVRETTSGGISQNE